jgi:predicted nucleic acid-binding protein
MSILTLSSESAEPVPGVVFIDTSVLINLLNVPGCSHHSTDCGVRDQLIAAGETLILPFTTIIETGNAITRDGGGRRYDLAKTFEAILRDMLTSTAPWVPSGIGLTHALLEAIVDGHNNIPKLLDLMTSGVGVGDATILAEMAKFRQRIPSATPVRLWTHDINLRGYSDNM